eukprot:CAMPEP_0172561170 /NCGR_PEP_ID=MMETSP1067-20121228/91822_1 /TAXON_ID=265564 ORGANISM="Thalassiosira punctigera, Strain Tpunct2005C2" /NCGR_SAMPLE_ID=MMETSP1067 /ASSEMBLY_ACC=CAM_ASM_000444 /LENGTH=336 /DNA_ID=CAMNT_0013351153 /DNA_START=172 /DNA_END=1179 /DNA_ORIENTATION=-
MPPLGLPLGATLSIAFQSVSTLKLCDGFLHSMDIHVTRSFGQRLTVGNEDDNIYRDNSHRWKHEPFDFSSKLGWDGFYKKGLQRTDDWVESASEAIDGEIAGDSIESLEYEWHGHIPHSAIVDAVEPAISAASRYYSSIQSATEPHPSILLVGCGNSALPRILHDAFDAPVRVTCLDYSPVCIEMIKSMYESTCPNMDFVVGDATNLQRVQWDGGTSKQSPEKKRFDVIIDKGLLDALMCGEGFDLERLMGGINDVLTPHDWGVHVLICFQLSRSSKQSLAELGNSGYDNEPSLVWDFDIPVEGSEDGRACFNLARRYRGQGNGNLGVEKMITTEW